MQVEVLGVHPVPEAPEPCHLVEVLVRDSSGLDPSNFGQQEAGGAPDDVQVAWDERVLDSSGETVLAAADAITDDPDVLTGDVRLAFFLHYLDPSLPLLTPVGPVPLPAPTERPERLATIEYEEP